MARMPLGSQTSVVTKPHHTMWFSQPLKLHIPPFERGWPILSIVHSGSPLPYLSPKIAFTAGSLADALNLGSLGGLWNMRFTRDPNSDSTAGSASDFRNSGILGRLSNLNGSCGIRFVFSSASTLESDAAPLNSGSLGWYPSGRVSLRSPGEWH